MSSITLEEGKSITHIWTRFNPRWVMAGIFSGVIAGLIVAAISGIYAAKVSGEFYRPLKLMGAAIFGVKATTYGPLGTAGMAGLGLHLILSACFGGTFAHLVDEKSKGVSLVILGVVTSLVIWVFGGCLFAGSFDLPFALEVSKRVILIAHILFGLSFGIILKSVRGLFIKD